MVKEAAMLISEFARAAGMSIDTVRFYVRRRLLLPKVGMKGGSNPYQIFDAEHLRQARIIRLAQSLGFSLKEIALLADEYNRGDMTPARGREVMADQLVRLERKRAELDAMLSYVRAKIAWMDGGHRGPEPEFGEVGACGVEPARQVRVTAAPRGRRKPVARAA